MPFRRRLFVFAFALIAVDRPASADSIRLLADSSVRARPDSSSEVLSVLKAGTILEAAPRQGAWYPILLPPDARGLRRYGYVAAEAAQPVDEQRNAAERLTFSQGASLNVFVDAAIAEHITETSSWMDVARNRGLADLMAREVRARLSRKGLRVQGADLTSVGLYIEESSVLRVVRNAGVANGVRVSHDDTRWDLDGHEYRVRASTRPSSDLAVEDRRETPFWMSPRLSAAQALADLLRGLYRELDAIDRLHPRGQRRSQGWQRSVANAGGLAASVPGEAALVILIRGRDRPAPAAVPRFFRDAFVDARYEVSGALASVFLVSPAHGRVVAWDSRIEGKTTEGSLRGVVGELVDTVIGRSLGG